VKDEQFREFVEAGKLMIYNVESGDRFNAYVPCIALLNWSPVTWENSKLEMVYKLLYDFKTCDQAAYCGNEWWRSTSSLDLVQAPLNLCPYPVWPLLVRCRPSWESRQ